ncbi:MAG: hypothetical protein WCK98_04900 [bacterium]
MPQIHWESFTKLEYWFSGIAGDLSSTPVIDKGTYFFWFFLSVFTVIFTIGVLLKIVSSYLSQEHPLNLKFNFWGDNIIWIGVLGDVWFLVRQLSVGFLGARFWVILLAIWGLVLFYFIARYFLYFFKIEYLYFQKNGTSITKKLKI